MHASSLDELLSRLQTHTAQDNTDIWCFNCTYDVITRLLRYLARDANALGSIKLEVEVGSLSLCRMSDCLSSSEPLQTQNLAHDRLAFSRPSCKTNLQTDMTKTFTIFLVILDSYKGKDIIHVKSIHVLNTLLTPICRVDYSILIKWASPCPLLGVADVLF